MGEIADQMLEGSMCQWCGEYLGEGDGFPVVCEGCQEQHGVDPFGEPLSGSQEQSDGPPKPRVGCPTCKRTFATHSAYDQHWRDKHGR